MFQVLWSHRRVGFTTCTASYACVRIVLEIPTLFLDVKLHIVSLPTPLDHRAVRAHTVLQRTDFTVCHTNDCSFVDMSLVLHFCPLTNNIRLAFLDTFDFEYLICLTPTVESCVQGFQVEWFVEWEYLWCEDNTWWLSDGTKWNRASIMSYLGFLLGLRGGRVYNSGGESWTESRTFFFYA